MVKTREAPLKKLTLQLLELMAGCVVANIYSDIHQENLLKPIPQLECKDLYGLIVNLHYVTLA